MAFKWSNAVLIQLIESYKGFECLWNPKHIKYKCRYEKHNAWTRLCDVTGADEVEIKRKMKNLIGQFYRERKKYRLLKRSGAGASFDSKWFAYNYLLFLIDKNAPGQCIDNKLNESEVVSSASENDMEEEQLDSAHFVMYDNLEKKYSLQVCDIDGTQTEAIDPLGTAPINHFNAKPTVEESVPVLSVNQSVIEQTLNVPQAGPSMQMYRKQPTKVNHSKMENNSKRRYSSGSGDERQEDVYMVLKELVNKRPRSRFQVFGEHVAMKMESLVTEHAQNTAEHLISNILFEASMGKYDNLSNLSHFQYNATAHLQAMPVFSSKNSYISVASESPSSALSDDTIRETGI